MKPETKKLLHDYRHFWLLICELIYLVWFTWLQSRDVQHVMVHSIVDDWIPFCEVFAIPYFLWFAYVFLAKVYFFFKSPEMFVRYSVYLYGGMYFILILYTLFPNGQNLRPEHVPVNLFTRAMKWLWSTDPPVNVCPSIHCYNSIGTAIALWRYKPIKEKAPVIYYGSPILAVLIMMSTVFLKQHSFVDVYTAVILAVPFYFLTFRRKSKLLEKLYL